MSTLAAVKADTLYQGVIGMAANGVVVATGAVTGGAVTGGLSYLRGEQPESPERVAKGVAWGGLLGSLGSVGIGYMYRDSNWGTAAKVQMAFGGLSAIAHAMMIATNQYVLPDPPTALMAGTNARLIPGDIKIRAQRTIGPDASALADNSAISLQGAKVSIK